MKTWMNAMEGRWMFSLVAESVDGISRATELPNIQVAEGTAIIWLKGDVSQPKREQLIETLLDDNAVENIFFSPSRANILNLGFRYGKLNYKDLLDRVRRIHQDSVIVGF